MPIGVHSPSGMLSLAARGVTRSDSVGTLACDVEVTETGARVAMRSADTPTDSHRSRLRLSIMDPFGSTGRSIVAQH